MASDSNGSNDREIAKTIYTSLRTEIIEKMKFSNQLLGYKLFSVGAIVGFVATVRDTPPDIFSVAGVFVGVGLALSFDLALYQNNKAIVTLGTFMKEHLEPWLKSICDNGSNRVMWEEFIAGRGSSNTRMIYNLFESANYLMTFFLMILGGIVIWLYKPWLIVSLFPLVVMEAFISYKGLTR